MNPLDGTNIDTLAPARGGLRTPATDAAHITDADIDRDGQVNKDDGTFFAAIPAAAPLGVAGAGGSGVISDPHDLDGPDNAFGHCGERQAAGTSFKAAWIVQSKSMPSGRHDL